VVEVRWWLCLDRNLFQTIWSKGSSYCFKSDNGKLGDIFKRKKWVVQIFVCGRLKLLTGSLYTSDHCKRRMNQ
jgi:hypothetical protein